MATTHTPDQLELLAALDRAVKERADAAKAIQDKTAEIASLCVDARDKNIVMRVLAEHVKVYDPKTEQLRSVTRQSVDGMIAELEGRARAPRRRQVNGSSGKINTAAFT